MKGATLTLSFGDVNFTLSALDDGGRVDFVKDKEDFVVSLSTFSGTLRVSSRSIGNGITSHPTLAGSLESPQCVVDSKRRLESYDRVALATGRSEPSKRIRDELAKVNDDASVESESTGGGGGVSVSVSVSMNALCVPPREDLHNEAMYQDPGSIGSTGTGSFKRADSIIRGYCKALDASGASGALDSPPSEKDSLFQVTAMLGQPDFSQSQSSEADTDSTSGTGTGTGSSLLQTAGNTNEGNPSPRTGPSRVSLGSTHSTHSPQTIDNVQSDFDISPSSVQFGSEPNETPKRERPCGSVPPCPRWGHSMTILDDNRLLVYGGQSFDANTGLPITLSDVHVCNLPDSSSSDSGSALWGQPFHCHGFPRQWHTSTYLPGRRLLISMGGESVGVGNDISSRHETTGSAVMVLDTEIMLWYPPTISGGTSPMANRSGHSATLLGSSDIVIFGGVRNKRTWLNTISILDCTAWKWYNIPKQLIQGSAPPPRSYHSAVAWGNDRIVVFGGNDKTKCFDSVHVLQRTQGPDVQGSHDATTFLWKWSHPVTLGSKPKARTGQTSVLLDDGSTIWVNGGWDPNEDDEVIDQHREASETSGNEEDEDMIFGDSFYLDTLTWTWTTGQSVPVAPKRVGHTAVLLPKRDQSDSSTINLFGGRVSNIAFSGDCLTLSV